MALVWVARGLEPEAPTAPVRRSEWWGTITLLVLIFIQLIAGAFVAGLDAGFAFNTWPLMGDTFVPAGMASLDPFWKNIFENTTTVQFIHRCIAYVIVLYVGFRLWQQSRGGGFEGVHKWLPRLSGLILFQVALGITTLVMVIPVELGVAHQVMAFILLGTTVAYLTDMSRAPRA